MKKEEELLTEEEKKALRGSKFAPLPSSRSQKPTRLAHPGGPLTTNKASALAKFLHRKLRDPNGLDSIDPQLLELAVKNAKNTVLRSGGASGSGRHIKHVDSFDDSEGSSEEEKVEALEPKKTKKKKNKKEKKKRKKHKVKDQDCIIVKKPKKKLKV